MAIRPYFDKLNVAVRPEELSELRALPRVDPYLVWALLTSAFKQQPVDDPDADDFSDRISVLVEVDNLDLAPWTLFPSYLMPPGGPDLKVVPVLLTPEALECMLFQPGTLGFSVRRFELNRARTISGRAVARMANKDSLVRSLNRNEDRWNALRAAGLPPAVCVIDDGCNFASAALRGKQFGRVASIWHQGNDEVRSKLRKAGGFKSALHLTVTAWPYPIGTAPPLPVSITGSVNGQLLEEPLQPAPDRSGVDEQPRTDVAHYAKRAYPFPLHRWSHGSAVLGLIAADRLWFRGANDRKGYVSSRAAPDAISFVQLPDDTVIDTSGGSLAAHALDGIRHALARALPGQHVIVNLSFGTHSGGHDGTSMWDSGLKELLDAFDGVKPSSLGKTLHVVLPAGNSHGWRCHASKGLGPTATDLELQWKVQPDNPHESFLEVWLPPGASHKISVRTPTGSLLEAECAAPGQPCPTRIELPKPQDEPVPSHALIWPQQVPQSDLGTMALVAVGPTARWSDLKRQGNALTRNNFKDGLRAAPHGIWTVTIHWTGGAPGETVHAWVQRADSAPGRPVRAGHAYPGRQSYLIDRSTGKAPTQGDVDPTFTLNGLATLKHPRLYVIGSMRRSDLGVSGYTAAGPNRITPTRFEGPDWLVAGDESLNLPGLLTHTTFAGGRMRLSGTSLAAAAFTRLLYEHLLDPVKMPLTPLPYCGGPHDRHWAEGDPQQAPGYHRGDSQRLLPDHPYGILKR